MTGMLAVTLDALSDLDAKVALDSQILAGAVLLLDGCR